MANSFLTFGTHSLASGIRWRQARVLFAISKLPAATRRLPCAILPVIAAALVSSIPLPAMEMVQAKTAPPSSSAKEKAGTVPASTFNIVGSGDSYAVVEGSVVTMSGAGDAAARVRELASKIHGNYIWFEHDGKSYIVDDPALVEQATHLVKPQEDLGRKQAELGEEQARLGREQTSLGKAQTVNGNPDVFKELSAIQSELLRLRSQPHDLPEDERAKIQSRTAELQGRLAQIKSPAGGQQSKLAEQQSKLAEQQSELAEQQVKLSETASHQLTALFNTALKNGQARAVK